MPRVSNQVDIPRLCGAIQRARLALRFPREQRVAITRDSVGAHWSEEGARRTMPVNLLGLYERIVVPKLVAKNPRVLLSTFQQPYKPLVAAMQEWANLEIEHLRLAETLQRVVQDALTYVGICKVALAAPAEAAVSGWTVHGGEPFAARIDLDDFVFDIHARDLSEVSFLGHRYRAPLALVRDSKLYSRERLELEPGSDSFFNLEGDERIGVMGRTTLAGSGDQEEFEDYVDLWEIYLPRHRLVLTLPDDHLAGPKADAREPLRAQRWLGPETGPYHLLAFGIVPGNALPRGPMLDLFDLNDFCNRTYRKLMRQADRQKSLTMVSGGADETGSRIMNASDGDILKGDNPQNTVKLDHGGPHQGNLAMFEQAKQLFSDFAGNLEILGGLGPQSKTATQDEMLAQNASGILASMQESTLKMTTSVVKALCWYWHHDPQRIMRHEHTLPGGRDMAITREVTPGERQAVRFRDIDLRVDPYSIQQQTPQARLQNLNQVMQQIVLPMMQMLQQQGISVDIEAYLEKVARYSDDPDLAEILTLQDPMTGMPPPGQGEQEGAGMPANTSRTYERVSRPGRTDEGNTQNLVASLLGKDLGGAPGNNGVQKVA